MLQLSFREFLPPIQPALGLSDDQIALLAFSVPRCSGHESFLHILCGSCLICGRCKCEEVP